MQTHNQEEHLVMLCNICLVAPWEMFIQCTPALHALALSHFVSLVFKFLRSYFHRLHVKLVLQYLVCVSVYLSTTILALLGTRLLNDINSHIATSIRIII